MPWWGSHSAGKRKPSSAGGTAVAAGTAPLIPGGAVLRSENQQHAEAQKQQQGSVSKRQTLCPVRGNEDSVRGTYRAGSSAHVEARR